MRLWLCLAVVYLAGFSDAGLRHRGVGGGKRLEERSSSSSLSQTNSSSYTTTSTISSSSSTSSQLSSKSYTKKPDREIKAAIIHNAHHTTPTTSSSYSSHPILSSASPNAFDQKHLVALKADGKKAPTRLPSTTQSSALITSGKPPAHGIDKQLYRASFNGSDGMDSIARPTNLAFLQRRPSGAAGLERNERFNGSSRAVNGTRNLALDIKNVTSNFTYPPPFDNQCQLWDNHCKGSRQEALNRFFENNGTMFHMVYNAHCVWSTDPQCDGWHLPDDQERALVHYLRSPKCNADFVDWHSSNTASWTWSERAYNGWSPGTVDFNQIATRTKSVGCCGQCEIYGGGLVDVHYWPVPGANTQCLETIGTDDLDYEQNLWVTDSRGYPYYKPQSNPWAGYSEHTNGQVGFTALGGGPQSTASQSSHGNSQITTAPVLPRALASSDIADEYVRSDDAGAPRVASFSGFRCTSPSVCVGFSSLFVHDGCGGLRTLGEIAEFVPYTVLAFDPGELSTIAKPFWEREDQNVPKEYIKPFDFKDLPCPPLDVQRSAGYKPEKGVPYRPVLAPPKRLSYIMPGWSKCILSQASFVGIDPPRTLAPIDNLVPAPTSPPGVSLLQPVYGPGKNGATPANRPSDGHPRPTGSSNIPIPNNLYPIYGDPNDSDDNSDVLNGDPDNRVKTPDYHRPGTGLTSGDNAEGKSGGIADGEVGNDGLDGPPPAAAVLTPPQPGSVALVPPDDGTGGQAPGNGRGRGGVEKFGAKKPSTQQSQEQGNGVPGGHVDQSGGDKPEIQQEKTPNKETPQQGAGNLWQDPSNVDKQGLDALHAALQPSNEGVGQTGGGQTGDGQTGGLHSGGGHRGAGGNGKGDATNGAYVQGGGNGAGLPPNKDTSPSSNGANAQSLGKAFTGQSGAQDQSPGNTDEPASDAENHDPGSINHESSPHAGNAPSPGSNFKAQYFGPNNGAHVDTGSSTTPDNQVSKGDGAPAKGEDRIDTTGKNSGASSDSVISGPDLASSDSPNVQGLDSQAPQEDGGNPPQLTTTIGNHPLVAMYLPAGSGLAISIAGKTLSANSPAITDPANGAVIALGPSALTVGKSTIPLSALSPPPNATPGTINLAPTTVSSLGLGITPVADINNQGQKQPHALIISGHTLYPSSPPLTLTLYNPTDSHKPPTLETLSLDPTAGLVLDGKSTIPISISLPTTAQELTAPATITLAGHIATLLPGGGVAVEGVTITKDQKETATLKDGTILALTSASKDGQEEVVLGTKTVGYADLVASAQGIAGVTAPGPGPDGSAAASATGSMPRTSGGSGKGDGGPTPFEGTASGLKGDFSAVLSVVVCLHLFIAIAMTQF